MIQLIGILLILSFVPGYCFNNNYVINTKEFDISAIVLNDIGINITEFCDNLSTRNISNLCGRQMEIVCKNPSLQWTFYDASSKFPYPGLFYATKVDLGNFDQCLSISHWEDDTRILGKFCANSLLIPTTINGTLEEIYQNAFKLSLCMPDLCSAEDAKNLFGIPTSLPLINDEVCTTVETDTEITVGDIVLLVIILIFINVIIFSTAYDGYLQRTERKTKSLLYTSFSLISNGKKLLQTTKGTKEQIMVFHGMKFVSMLWIIAGHGFAVLQMAAFSNDDDAKTFQDSRYSQYITTAYMAVDTFFFISGFLMAYQYFKSKPKPLRIQALKVPNMYLHRYFRLTPALLMVFLFHITLHKHMGLGPVAHYGREMLRKPCIDYWYAFFFYFQNYNNPDSLCLTHTWYLSADMQMFVVAPLILIPVSMHIKRNFSFAMFELLGINIFLTLLPILLRVLVRDYDNEYDTHSRLINYFVGVMFGCYIRERKDAKFPFSERLNLIIWAVILTAMVTIFVVYKEVELEGSFVGKAIFSGLYRPAWCICLCWVVYSCYHGYGGIVTWILSRPLLQIGSKLTYCMYLVHGHVIMIHLLYMRERIHFSDYEVFYMFCGHLIITWILAMIWTLSFESPLIAIEKMIFGNPTPRNNLRQAKSNIDKQGQDISRNEKAFDLKKNGSEIYRVTKEI